MIEFEVLGAPVGKGRPRFARRKKYVATYTPQATIDYQELVVASYKQQCGNFRFEDGDYLYLYIEAVYPIPSSTSKKAKALMLINRLLPNKKPDYDNIEKIITDALNNVAFKDDASIIEGNIFKHYGETPKVKVCIAKINPELLPENLIPVFPKYII